MVDVGVGQNHGFDVGGPERKGAIVKLLLGLGALKHPAVHQDLRAVSFQQKTGPGHCSAGSMKSKTHALCPSLDPQPYTTP